MLTARAIQIIREFSQNGMKLPLENAGNVQDLLTLGRLESLDLIDFGRMQTAGTSFVASDYRRVESDVVLTAPLRRSKGRPARERILVHLLIEHQSEPDELMPLRVLDYVVQVFKAQVREWSQTHASFTGIRLQPVLPVVFYTGTRTWESVGDLVDLIEGGEQFADRTPMVKPLFVNLTGLEPGQLETEGGPFGQVLRLVRGRRAPLADFQPLLQEVTQRLEGMPGAQRLRRLELLSYTNAFVYHERAPTEWAKLHKIIQTSVQTDEHRREVTTMQKSMADVVKEEARKEEAIRSRQEMLLLLLRERFGKLPRKVAKAVEGATDVAQLEEWARQFAHAKTLAEIEIAPTS
ncbi:MAG: Rpn family recombination-promoting nuclease/putative transposase [Gemmataceae bacterium]|nr:Rpn family recombination-promoting nuclease/putative transposase [Gemmataceae bacterium]